MEKIVLDFPANFQWHESTTFPSTIFQNVGGGIFHNAEETISSLALSLQEDQSFSRIKFHDRIIIPVINLLLKMENLSNWMYRKWSKYVMSIFSKGIYNQFNFLNNI